MWTSPFGLFPKHKLKTMTFVNEKGGNVLSLTVLATERSEFNCMLKEPILKKSENYTVQLTDFVLSTLPVINPNIHKPFLTMVPYDEADMPAIYGTEHIFTPVHCTSVLALYTQLRRFCERFTRMFYRYGLGDDVDVFVSEDIYEEMLEDDQRAVTPINFHKPHINEEDGLFVELSSDLRLRVFLGKEISQNFFLQFSDYAAHIIGLPQQIFDIERHGGETLRATMNYPIIFEDGDFTVTANDILANRILLPDHYEPSIFESEESIKNLDERMSIDLISTFPVSRKVCIFNGEHSEEYLLGRFDVSSFREFHVENKYAVGVVTEPQLKVSEKHNSTAINMTAGFPNYESNHFIGGAIQNVHFQVLVRYIDQHKKITRVPLEMEDGYYQVRCLFTKKL